VARRSAPVEPPSERLTSGHHFAAFCQAYLRHTMQVPSGPRVGSPFALEDFQRLFWDEALELEQVVSPVGEVLGYRRVYKRAGRIQPRKTGKTTELAAFSEYMGGPFDGEQRPTVILAAGSRDQAGELFDQAKAFIDDPVGGSPELRALFVPRMTSITCPSVGGVIRRVAGDGKLNHSLNPHVVVADELHAWKTKRQRENWKALTTAQGAREDPMVVFITTEGEDEDDELFDLMERIIDDPNTEVEVVHKCFTIYRNRPAGMLVHRYGCPPETSLDDIETIKLANPASWRTKERLLEDLADPLVDANTKRRLYMGIRVAGSGRWISDEKLAEAASPRTIPAGAVLGGIGVDAAKTRDTTAVGWAWIDPDTGECFVDCHVWSCRPGVACDTFVEGGRLDNDDARDFVREVLLERFNGRLVFYDERYFGTQALDLSQDGLTVVEMHQGKPEMVAAWNEFYADLHGAKPLVRVRQGAPGRTLVSHIKAAKGKRNAAGDSWKVHKEDLPIDALAAVVMARYAARHFGDYVRSREPWAIVR